MFYKNDHLLSNETIDLSFNHPIVCKIVQDYFEEEITDIVNTVFNKNIRI